MPKYNAKSADVLNEADDFEKRLSYQLFVAEQDARLFGPVRKGQWRPGDPIYHGPQMMAYMRSYGFRTSDGYEGNVTRPMIQEIDTELDLSPYKCKSCEVSWYGGTLECWCCGETTEKFGILFDQEEWRELFDTNSSWDWFPVDDDFDEEQYVKGYFDMMRMAEAAVTGLQVHYITAVYDETERVEG